MFEAEIKLTSTTDKELTFSVVCPFCGKTITHSFPNTREFYDGLEKFKRGCMVQNAFPWMGPSEREFFLTGNCSCVWGEEGY